MGGEPTFVSVDDRDGAEWNTDAWARQARDCADLLKRLRTATRRKGLLHFGQGKWYPGEQLPRWSLACFWRKDGEPVWERPALFADEAYRGAHRGAGALFLRTLAEQLGSIRSTCSRLRGRLVLPVARAQAAANVDPFDSRLEIRSSASACAGFTCRASTRSPGTSSAATRSFRRWRSGRWFLREERCYLVPGDSPLGLRLPLDSLPGSRRATQPCPCAGSDAAFSRLPRAARSVQRKSVPRGRAAAPSNPPLAHAHRDLRRAAQRRAYIFMPPPRRSRTTRARQRGRGHRGPSRQPGGARRLRAAARPAARALRIPPDPGVLEVNIHPARNWRELADNTSFLYEQARETRSAPRSSWSTAATPAPAAATTSRSAARRRPIRPFCAGPNLLASLLAYWHNHPSLSYLFSGAFIGPTSQHPRVDEARNDSVYELEVAFRELEKHADRSMPLWLVDRLFRNLLIDVTGNTHRAEFCIDKLYAPEGPTGRLGLLELRAFEMPPHARMSLTQQLLLRSLVARFWQRPYRPARLARWGTGLHDRFMLPWFVWQDFEDVIEETRRDGYELKAEWFAPHFEFRFPRVGEFSSAGAKIELRSALEPWNVMGEEGAPGGTVRYVDSSVERLQVHATGLVGERHVLACNGRALPLAPTGKVGDFVAGVRYKAWSPASALHPRSACMRRWSSTSSTAG
jgi:uncharacterized protein (DUF2126 family)